MSWTKIAKVNATLWEKQSFSYRITKRCHRNVGVFFGEVCGRGGPTATNCRLREGEGEKESRTTKNRGTYSTQHSAS